MSRHVAKLKWLANRLAAMSAGELIYRVRQSAFRKWAAGQDFAQAARQGSNILPTLPGLGDRLHKVKDSRALRDEVRDVAQRIMQGPFFWQGRHWPEEKGDERWHRDPVSGGLWPSDRFTYNIDFRHRGTLGDPKYVWQPNKLQHLHGVAMHVALTGDVEAARFCVEEVESWLRANPPFMGINWASGVECTARILAFGLLGSLVPGQFWSAATRQSLNLSLERHGYWLAHNLSLHSSANNHLIVELAGLFLVSQMSPHLPGAAHWYRMAQVGLEREALLQFTADGWSREQSPTYGAWSLEWLGLCAWVASRAGRPFSKPVMDHLLVAADCLAEITDENGHLPRIGDDDDATALDFWGDRNAWVRSVSGLVRSLAVPEQQEMAPPCLLSAFGFAPPTTGPKSGLQHFDGGGVSVFRARQLGAETLLLFDHGALGYLSIAAHGHADTLAIWLHRNGRPVIVDTGTYTYGGDAKLRDLFRSTAFHNTLSVDGENSSQMSGPFNWSRHCEGVLTASNSEGGGRVTAQHGGFRGVLHERSVVMADHGIHVTDRLLGAANARQADIRFHLAPDLRAVRTGDDIKVYQDTTFIMRVHSFGPLAWQDADGELPRSGWYSPRLGEKVASCVLTLSGKITSGDSQVTYLDFQS